MSKVQLCNFVLLVLCVSPTYAHSKHHVDNSISENQAKQMIVEQVSPVCGIETTKQLVNDPRLQLVPPATGPGMTLTQFRAYMLSPESVQHGLDFIKQNQSEFDKLSNRYTVDKYTITSVARIETNFGAHTGKASIMNALYTQVVKAKRKWKKDAIVQLRVVCLLNQIGIVSPFDTPASPSGAFGITQFMPATYLEYAVDGDDDDIIDLFSVNDAIASTANFLQQHGYAKNKRKAIRRYNPWTWYIDSVMMYAQKLKQADIQ